MDTGLDDFVRTAASRVTGIAAFLVLVCSGAALAESGQTSGSATPTRAALASATAACNWDHNRDKPRVLTGSPVLAVARGDYTAQIYLETKNLYICVSDGTRDHTGFGSDNGVLTFDAAPGPDQLGLPAMGGGSAPGFTGTSASDTLGAVLHALGRAGRDVSAVAFVFSGGNTVDATVKNGWYFAWWPNSDQPQSVRVIASSKTITARMPGPNSCHLGSKGCAWAGTKKP